MYLVVIGWMYVVLMMSVAEASSTTGTVLGAIVTFFMYGLFPVALVVYLMRTPQRRTSIKNQEAAEHALAQQALHSTVDASEAPVSTQPDTGSHAPGAAASDSVTAVGKKT